MWIAQEEIYNRRSIAPALPVDFQRSHDVSRTLKGNTGFVLATSAEHQCCSSAGLQCWMMFFDQRNFIYHHTNSASQTNLLNAIDFFRVLLIALLTCLSAMKGGAAPVLIQCCVDAWHYRLFRLGSVIKPRHSPF